MITTSKPTTTFRLDARTSTAQVIIGEGQPVWPGDLAINPDADAPIVPEPCKFEGFRPALGAMISLEARGSEPYVIVVTGKNSESAGRIYCKGEPQIDAPNYVSLAFARKCDAPPCQPPVIRFVGDLTVGASISETDLTPAVLESGTLVMETDSLIKGFGRVESVYTLDKGDRLSFSVNEPIDAGPQATGLFVEDRLDDEPLGFHVIARVDASDARVLPFGPERDEAIAVAPTFVERLQAGAQGLLLGVIAAICLHIVSVLTSIHDFRNPKGDG